jgi:hypothetical protein
MHFYRFSIRKLRENGVSFSVLRVLSIFRIQTNKMCFDDKTGVIYFS